MDQVLNLQGSEDWVVLWFPGMFQWLRESFFSLRSIERLEYLGSAGFGGFSDDLKVAPVILAGSHSAATQQAHHAAIAQFLIEGTRVFPANAKQSILVGGIGRFPLLVWAAIFVLAMSIGLWFGLSLALGGLVAVAALIVLVHWV